MTLRRSSFGASGSACIVRAINRLGFRVQWFKNFGNPDFSVLLDFAVVTFGVPIRLRPKVSMLGGFYLKTVSGHLVHPTLRPVS